MTEGSTSSDDICVYYIKTGTCQRGEFCNRTHPQSPLDRAILFHHLFPDPDLFIESLPPGTLEIPDETKQRLLDAFFLDVGCMCINFGILDDLIIVGNHSDALSGNVIALFTDSDSAYKCLLTLNNQYYAGRKIFAELVPVQKISASVCNSVKGCEIGDSCNFVHPLEPSPRVFNQIISRQFKGFPNEFRKNNSRRPIDNPNNALYPGKLQIRVLYDYMYTSPTYCNLFENENSNDYYNNYNNYNYYNNNY